MAVLGVLLVADARAYSLTQKEQDLAGIFTSASGQKRPFLRLDNKLARVAHARAVDMAARDYFGHVNPDGHGPNYLVEKAGYTLPAWWGNDPTANYIESIAGGYASAREAWSAWMNSAEHRRHLLAENSFYKDQTNYGIGYAYSAGSTYKHYWVIITAPPQPEPALVITSPRSGSRTANATLNVAGTTNGDGVVRVECRIENGAGSGPWTTAEGIQDWHLVLDGMQPGKNIMRVRSVNAAEEEIATKSVTVVFVAERPLTVNVVGAGTVTDGFAGTTLRELAQTYVIKAAPAPGWLFAGWSGGSVSAKPTLSFVMTEGLELTANFVPNPFPPLAGTFQGLLEIDGALALVHLKIGARGTFSGKVVRTGGVDRVAGALDAFGKGQLTVNGQDIELELDLVSGALSLTLDGTAVVLERRASEAGTLAGRYNLALPARPEMPGGICPDGTGYAVMKIDRSGRVRLAGRLGDGTSFARSASLSSGGTLPVFISARGGSELTAGHVRFDDSTGAARGELSWVRAANAVARFFAQGFAAVIDVTGCRYDQEAPLDLAGATLTLGAGNLDSEIIETIASQPQLLRGTAQAPVQLVANPAKGLIAGRFIHPADGQERVFRGVLLPDQNAAFGFFRGIDQTGYVRLEVRQ